jgi:hypothetical protein
MTWQLGEVNSPSGKYFENIASSWNFGTLSSALQNYYKKILPGKTCPNDWCDMNMFSFIFIIKNG